MSIETKINETSDGVIEVNHTQAFDWFKLFASLEKKHDFGHGPETKKAIIRIMEEDIIAVFHLIANEDYSALAEHLWKKRGTLAGLP